MGITRSTGALLGTDETTLSSSIANNASQTGTEVDILGSGNDATGTLKLYAVITSTVTAGSVDIFIQPRRVTGEAYTALAAQFSVSPTNGTQKLYLGDVAAPRFATSRVLNNATGASLTISILYELHKVS